MSSHSVTTKKSWFERLGNSFGGIIFGIVFFIVGTILLWWNEGNFVKTQIALKEAQSVVQELGDCNMVCSSLNGQLIHATGQATTEDVLEDPIFGISKNAMRLERSAEYYQWVENSKSETRQKMGGGEETVITYSYKKDWVSDPVDSSRFISSNATEANKNTVIANIDDLSVRAENVTFGAYQLPKFLSNSISSLESLPVEFSDEAIAQLNKQFVPDASSTPLPTNTPAQGLLPFEDDTVNEGRNVALATPLASQKVHLSNGTVYLGQSPTQPSIGDVRVTFKWTKPENTVSLIAKLNGSTFESYTAKNGKTVSMLSMGTHSAENMFETAHSSNAMLTWIFRVVGIVVVCFGISMILSPLSVLASVVPFLGKLVGIGTGVVSLFFGTAWSLMVIALAWLFYRPWTGIVLLAVAVLLLMFLFTRKRPSLT